MHSPLHRLIAQERAEEFRRAATERAAARHISSVRAPLMSPVTLRFGFPDDVAEITRLATLDSSLPPRSPVLVAEVAGRLRAAVSLSDGSVVSDPFFPSAAVVDLLRARAGQLTADRHAVGARLRRRLLGRRGLPAFR